MVTLTAGFFPAFKPNGLLFGLLDVTTIHSIVYIVSGVIAIMAATSYKYSQYYFKIFGILYALLAIAGIVGDLSVIMMHFNLADNLLHVVIALLALYLGFSSKNRRVRS